MQARQKFTQVSFQQVHISKRFFEELNLCISFLNNIQLTHLCRMKIVSVESNPFLKKEKKNTV